MKIQNIKDRTFDDLRTSYAWIYIYIFNNNFKENSKNLFILKKLSVIVSVYYKITKFFSSKPTKTRYRFSL